MTHQTENTIEETKQTFADYFNLAGQKDFRKFYYDWHIDSMLAPFAGMAVHFQKTYGKDAELQFAKLADEITQNVQDYNNDKPQLSLLKTSKFSHGNTKRLSSLLEGIESFGFDFRQFFIQFCSARRPQPGIWELVCQT